MFAVNVGDRRGGELFRRNVFKAAKIHAVDLPLSWNISYAERAHAAVLAEIVLIAHGVEQIFGELRLARKKTKRFWLHDSGPKTVSRAD